MISWTSAMALGDYLPKVEVTFFKIDNPSSGMISPCRWNFLHFLFTLMSTQQREIWPYQPFASLYALGHHASKLSVLKWQGSEMGWPSSPIH